MAFNKAKALQEAQKYVTQGKTPQAIKLYQQIAERDPSDLILLNTIGDLYIREKRLGEALKHFYRLAEAYVTEGFVVKAIAIYKKISKLDQSSIEPVLKLAELYVTQGLNREAREQYATALHFFQKSKQQDKALEVLRKMAQLEPQNPKLRIEWAGLAEQSGQAEEAAEAYLEAATLLQREGDAAGAENALKKAAQLHPNNARIQLSLAHHAFRRQDFEQAEKIARSVLAQEDNPSARRLLLECYLATHKLAEAQQILMEVYRANPSDFTPIANFADLCMARKDFEAAFQAVNLVAQELQERKETEGLMQSLRKIWAGAPQHVPTLELVYQISEATADEFTIPEVLEALGHAYVQTGQLEKAEIAYRKLAVREPENQDYLDLLRQVLQKQGKEFVAPSLSPLSSETMALESPTEIEAPPEEAAMVKEAIEASDLFVRYNLPGKAVAELEKVLATYPDQIEIHQRILEACRKNLPARAAQAAEALARIYGDRGDTASAQHYREIAHQLGAPEAGTTAPSSVAEMPAPSAPQEIDLSQEFGFVTPEVQEGEAPQEIPLDLGPGGAGVVGPPAEPEEVSATPGGITAKTPEPAPVLPPREPELPPFDYRASEEELRFYVSQGLVAEAQKAVEDLKAKYPGHPEVMKLAEWLEQQTRPPAEAAAPEGAWELPTTFAKEASPPAVSEPPAEPAARAEAPAAGSADLVESLASELASSLGGIEAPEKPGAASEQKSPAEPVPATSPAEMISPLGDLLSEFGEVEPSQAGADDPETHYNLGVAFREMGLLDEAIGEFQKVVKGSAKGNVPPNFLQACTLLAASFREKEMPGIAAKWYLRALEMPGLDEEATLAVLYDLGLTYEEAGDVKSALEKFTEVYSQNIDYRDVAEKIRLLRQKAS